jgi:enoyl-[acyl-carrier protein] reductase II
LPSRVMKTESAYKQLKRGLDVLGAFFNSADIAKNLHLPYLKMLKDTLAQGRKKSIALAYTANSFKQVNAATVKGDVEKGILPLGQSAGLINDIPTVSEVIRRIVDDAEEISRKISGMMQEG